jgi:cobyrinic acid a,c-diamide synthase
MCHRASDDRAWQCACGYEFGQQVEKTRELLRDQLVTAKILLAILLVVDAGAVFGMVEAVIHGFAVFSGFAFCALVLATIRQIRKIAISRESLRLLAPKDLPVARVVGST